MKSESVRGAGGHHAQGTLHEGALRNRLLVHGEEWTTRRHLEEMGGQIAGGLNLCPALYHPFCP